MKKSHNSRPDDPELDYVLRTTAKMTAREIAELSNGMIGRSTIYNWRAGRVSRPLNYTMTAVMAVAGFRKEWRKIK